MENNFPTTFFLNSWILLILEILVVILQKKLSSQKDLTAQLVNFLGTKIFMKGTTDRDTNSKKFYQYLLVHKNDTNQSFKRIKEIESSNNQDECNKRKPKTK